MSDPVRVIITKVEVDPPTVEVRDVRVQVIVANPSEATYLQLAALVGHEITLGMLL